MDDIEHKELHELGRFLKALRGRKQPDDQHIKHRRRKRTSGLRRVDVSEKTGIHIDTLTKIEQGKYPSLTAHMLKAILNALEATPDETSYALNLFIAVGVCPTFFQPTPTHIPPEIQRLLDDEEPWPAYVHNKRWDIVGSNRPALVVFPMIPRLDDPNVQHGNSFASNVLYFMFLDPIAQQVIDEWEGHIERIVKEFRSDYAKHIQDKDFLALVEYLDQHSTKFSELWHSPPVVSRKFPSKKRVLHPTLGTLLFEQIGTRIDHYPDLMLVFYKPQDEETEQALRLLQRSWQG